METTTTRDVTAPCCGDSDDNGGVGIAMNATMIARMDVMILASMVITMNTNEHRNDCASLVIDC